MRARKKEHVGKVARMIVDMVRDGMRRLSLKEQERRLKSFCDASGGRPRIRAKASGSSQPAPGRMAARGRG